MIEVFYQLDAYDIVVSETMSMQLSNILPIQSINTHVDGSDEFRSISDINSKHQEIVTPGEISSRL